jgi:hypothetical protein
MSGNQHFSAALGTGALANQRSPERARERPVAEEQRTKRADMPACARCGAAMEEILTILPVVHEKGLIAYECPKCGYLSSLLIDPVE